MSNTSTATRSARTTRKPRSKPQRFARLLSGILPSGARLVRLEERKPRSESFTHYFVKPLASDFGTAAEWSKFETEGGETYCVNTGDASNHASCECLGYVRHGHCKHIAATKKLIAEGKLS